MVRRGLAESGAKAQALILAGRIVAPGLRVLKPGALVEEDQELSLTEPMRYVSRGGEKLEGALKDLGVDPKGKVCLDVGASTGGFTDCLLQNGAKLVMAVDVGHGQLHWKLRQDRRVVNREKTHIKDVTPQDAADLDPQLAVVDVSFISLEKVLPHVAHLLKSGVEVLAMLKPQFEAGPKNAPKGVVKNPKVRAEVIARIKSLLPDWGFRFIGEADCVIKGPKGNLEHFLHFVKK